MIGRIATGEADDVAPDDGKDPVAKAAGAKGRLTPLPRMSGSAVRPLWRLVVGATIISLALNFLMAQTSQDDTFS